MDLPVTALASLDADQIRQLARESADSGVLLHEANRYEPGTWQHLKFEHGYWDRHRELVPEV